MSQRFTKPVRLAKTYWDAFWLGNAERDSFGRPTSAQLIFDILLMLAFPFVGVSDSCHTRDWLVMIARMASQSVLAKCRSFHVFEKYVLQ
jgi:hypothetical protein